MGCWDETCAITRATIFGENAVAMIVPTKDSFKRWRDVDSHWYNTSFIFSCIEKIVYGTYDTYGGINEDENKHDPDAILILKEVWDELTKSQLSGLTYNGRDIGEYFEEAWNNYLGYLRESYLDKDDARKFYQVVYFCNLARIDLTGGRIFKGQQFSLQEEINAYKLMSKLVQVQAKKIQKRFNRGDE